jgi:hypothetical protein
MSREMSSDTSPHLDGNAAAGLLREVFAMEMTTAIARCSNCGASAPVGELMLYGGEIGMILRCPGCDHLLICITHTPEGYWLDLRGLQILRIADVR